MVIPNRRKVVNKQKSIFDLSIQLSWKVATFVRWGYSARLLRQLAEKAG